MEIPHMNLLNAIQEQTERLIIELQWDNDQINNFVHQVNQSIRSNSGKNSGRNEETSNILVCHPGKYSGGFILFGGWTKIYDNLVPSGTRGHELYLAFGGLGAGGWSGDCDIEVMTEGSFEHEGKRYFIPVNHYGGNDWNGYQTAYTWFYDHVKSFMFMYLPVFAQPIPVFVYFDGSSNRIGLSVPNASLSIGIGGGTVTVEK